MIPDWIGCGRRQYRMVQPLIEQSTHKGEGGADRYRKHFMARPHIWLLILHLAHGGASLRQSHAQLGANLPLRQRLGMPDWVSLSQLARPSTSRQPDCFEWLLGALTSLVKRTPLLRRDRDKDHDWLALNRTIPIDSTFLRLSAKLSPWSKQGGYEAGVRVQYSLELATHIPQLLCIHGVAKNDHVALHEQDLASLAGWTIDHIGRPGLLRASSVQEVAR